MWNFGKMQKRKEKKIREFSIIVFHFIWKKIAKFPLFGRKNFLLHLDSDSSLVAYL